MSKLGEREHIELNERQSLREDHVSWNAPAVGRYGIHHKGAVGALDLCEQNARNRRIDVEAPAHVRVVGLPELHCIFARHEVGVPARVIDRKGLVREERLAHAVAVFGKAKVAQAVARHLGLDLAVWTAGQTCAVLGRNIAFTENIRVGIQELHCRARLVDFIFNGAAAVGIDVREMERIAVGHLHRLDHAFQIGAVCTRAGMPGHIGTALKCGFNERGGDFWRQRIMAAQELHPERTFGERLVDQLYHFRLGGRIGFKGEGRRRKLQNGRIQTRPVLRRLFENIVQGTSHVETRRHAVHREHTRSVGRPPHTAEMHVTVDDAGLEHPSGNINDFAGGTG